MHRCNNVRSPYGLKFQAKSILKICVPVKTNLNQKPVICVCISMQLKRKMCHVQSAISFIVRTGQVIFVLYCLGASNVTEVSAYS